ncbi:uncharacterized protein LOC118644497 isoform X2 [Monomorium pharaonis]|uniref:uncharacterized protein LOC118644497 isoform X2 n=1 Tax=Monomorium pharaonis TaxID=307658 RepID=UPI0017478B27|nr:uncharacterized protein LOC118644497 isoform X2 [Monomorium pharaonis]
MADKETADLLKAWGFEETFVQHFEAQAINISLLECLTHRLIKELIPNIGLRMRFTMKWTEHFKKDDNQNQNTSDTSSCESSCESEETPLKKKKLIVGTQTYKRLQRPTVREILKENAQGALILRNYAKNKILTKYCRHMLVELIISNIINTVKGTINKHDFLQLAQEIVEIFPSEDINLYYIAPVSKKDSLHRKSVSVRGKLVEKYRNKLQQNKRILISDFSDVTSTDVESEISSVSTEVLDASVKWLETNREPWEMVENHWKATATIRLKDAENNRNKLLSDIFEKWPILIHPMGWLLIVHDFQYLEYCTTEDGISQWPQFFSNVAKICPLEKKKIFRARELFQIIESDNSDESKAIAQLCALPYMIPPKGRIRTKEGHWKPSMIECEESLVIHAKTAGDITEIREQRIDAMYQKGLTVQPYIIVVGPTLAEITSFFVSVDKVLYNMTSAFKAIDTCFKIFHVLNIEYPTASNHIWLLIQRELYKFTTKYDRNSSFILEVINAMKKNEA